MSKKQETALAEKKDGALAVPSTDNWNPTIEGGEELRPPRLIIHQGDISVKFWGEHPKGTLIESTTGELLPPAPLEFIAIGINWTEYLGYGAKVGDPIRYHTRSKSDVPPEDFKWNDDETDPKKRAPRCTTLFNHMILIPGRPMPLILSMKKGSKSQRKFTESLNQYQQMRGMAKRGPGKYELALRPEENAQGKWLAPVLRSLGDPSPEEHTMAVDFYRMLSGVKVMTDTKGIGEPDAGYDPNLDG